MDFVGWLTFGRKQPTKLKNGLLLLKYIVILASVICHEKPVFFQDLYQQRPLVASQMAHTFESVEVGGGGRGWGSCWKGCVQFALRTSFVSSFIPLQEKWKVNCLTTQSQAYYFHNNLSHNTDYKSRTIFGTERKSAR